MRRMSTLLAAGLCAGALVLQAPARAADMSLTRLDCGTPQAPTAVNQRFSDTYSYGDLKLQFVYSCYLIKHDDQYLLWDTGHAMTTPNVAPKVSIVDQIAQLGVKPEQITFVGISHYHADHTGQVASFPKAVLLIGQGDWNAITAPKPAEGVNFAPFEGWIKGENKVDARAARQGRVRRRQRDDAVHAGSHAGPPQPPGQAAASGQFPDQRRRRAFPRELRHRWRAGVQFRPRRDAGLDRTHEKDRRKSSRRRSSSSTTLATSANCRHSRPAQNKRSYGRAT